MPIIAAGASLFGRAAAAVGRFFGTGAAVTAGAIGRPAVRAAGRVLTGPTARAVGLGTAGGFLGASFADGGGGGLAQAIEEQGGQAIRPLAGGRLLVRTPDGGIGIVTRMGRLVNPTVLVPSGGAVPPGGTLVSISADGALIGFTIRRKRRPFASELRRVRSVLSSVNALHRSMQPRKRRSS